MAKTTPAAKTTKLPAGVPRTANGKRLGRPTEAERAAAGKAPAADTKIAKAKAKVVKAPKAAKVVKPVAKKAATPVTKKAAAKAKKV